MRTRGLFAFRTYGLTLLLFFRVKYVAVSWVIAPNNPDEYFPPAVHDVIVHYLRTRQTDLINTSICKYSDVSDINDFPNACSFHGYTSIKKQNPNALGQFLDADTVTEQTFHWSVCSVHWPFHTESQNRQTFHCSVCSVHFFDHSKQIHNTDKHFIVRCVQCFDHTTQLHSIDKHSIVPLDHIQHSLKVQKTTTLQCLSTSFHIVSQTKQT